MSDINYYMAHGYSREESKNQVAADKASANLMITVFGLFFKVMFFLFLIFPSLFCAYLLLIWLRQPIGSPKGLNYFWWLLGTAYVLECFVFCVKGWHLRLKEREHTFWIVLRIFCFLYFLVLPVLMFHAIIADQFRHQLSQHEWRGILISWIGGAILGGVIFWRYGITRDTSPWLFRWAYWLGRRAKLKY